MNNNVNQPNLLLMTKEVKKGMRIYPKQENMPIAVAEEDFVFGDVGEIDYSIIYPVIRNKDILLLPGLKKNLLLKGKIQLKKEKKCQNRKKKE